MPLYDATQNDPPAPIAEVALRNPETGAELASIVMLLDTGADVTLIPREAAASIGCQPTNAHLLSGFDGGGGSHEEVLVEMRSSIRRLPANFLRSTNQRVLSGATY